MKKQESTLKTCADGKRHTFRIAPLHDSYNGKNYYEHLKVGKKTETYSVIENGTYVNKTKEIDAHIDETPGIHYQMIFCSGCGEQKEIIVKQHGPNFKELNYDTRRG